MKNSLKYFMLFSIICFVLLGLWQLERLQWKNKLIKTAQLNSILLPLDRIPEKFAEAHLYRKVKFKGEVITTAKPIIIPESYKQKYYYRILAPVKIENQEVLVDFGLSPSKHIKLPSHINSRGIIFNFDRKNLFYPGNNPDKLVWYNTDYQTLNNYLGIKIEPYLIKIIEGFSTNSEFIIKPFATSYRNDHLMYAITWFMLAFFCTIIFYFRVKTK